MEAFCYAAKRVAIAIVALLCCAPLSAHDAITGWRYPIQCCGEGDCAHATAAKRNPDGSLTVTTKHGTATFPASFKYEPSPDGMIHACFTPTRLYCLYLSTGM
jgi:hypothetical protein